MRLTRLVVFSLFLVFLLAAMLSAGCATKPTVTYPIVLSVAPASCPPPPAAGMVTELLSMADLITERTNGQLQLEFYWGQSLVNGGDVVTGLQTNICDIGVLSSHMEPGKIPLSLVGQAPGVGMDMWARAMAYYDICAQNPEKSELAEYNIRNISVVLTTESYIISGVPIRTIDDLKGKKLAASGMQAEILEELGGVAVAMNPGEQYEGLQKGTIDGIICPTGAVFDFHFYEVGKYFTRIPFGYRTYAVGINQDVWDDLPDDIQDALTDLAPDFINAAYEGYMEGDNLAIEAMQDNNIEFIEISAADLSRAMAIEGELADEWAASIGDDGEKILDDYRSLVAEYEEISPYK